jgi:hypothetical protein
MRIVQGADTPAASAAPAAGPAAAPDIGRVDALEKIAKSILQRLQSLEEKVEAQEKALNSFVSESSVSPSPEDVPLPLAPAPPAGCFSAAPPAAYTASLDTEAVKKGLLSKMWKHLNDERRPKAA